MVILIDERILIISFMMIGGGATFFFTYYFLFYIRKRFKCFILAKYKTGWKKVKEMWIKFDVETFKWKDKEFKVNFEGLEILDKRNKPELYFDYTTAKPIMVFQNTSHKEGSKAFKTYMDEKSIGKLGKREMDKLYLYIIIGLAIGIIALGAYAIYNQSMMNKQIIELTKQMLNQTKTGGGIVVK